jgi:hypothetical protein
MVEVQFLQITEHFKGHLHTPTQPNQIVGKAIAFFTVIISNPFHHIFRRVNSAYILFGGTNYWESVFSLRAIVIYNLFVLEVFKIMFLSL